MIEYETVWAGERGHYLCVRDLPASPVAKKDRSTYPAVKARVWAVLPTERADALTRRELMAIADCTESQIDLVFGRLRRAGLLAASDYYPHVYWKLRTGFTR